MKPIRIFYSPLTGRLFASQRYKDLGNGNVEITGEKFDVTNEIAGLIEQHEITFIKRKKPEAP